MSSIFDPADVRAYHERRPDADGAGGAGRRSPRYLSFQQRYRDDRVAFAHDCFRMPAGERIANYQDETLALVDSNERTTAVGPRGLGKTTIMAMLVHHHALVNDGGDDDWKAATLAGWWRQLEEYLWPEINVWATRIRWDRVGRSEYSQHSEMLTTRLNLRTGSAFGMASDKPKSLEGAHARRLFFGIDEAKAIGMPTFAAVEGGFSTTGVIKVFMGSTPGEPAGYFYNAVTHQPGYERWAVRRVTLDEAIREGRVKQEWVDWCRTEWGEESSDFKNHCLGQFSSSDQSGVVPDAWVLRAFDRWDRLRASGELEDLPLDQMGLDVSSGHGKDYTVRARRSGDWVTSLEQSKDSEMETAGLVKAEMEHEQRRNPDARLVIDVNNVGSGVYSRLEEQSVPNVISFVGQGKTKARDKSGKMGFFNMRSLAYWRVREWLNPEGDRDPALPRSDTLKQDLTSPRWRVNSSGQYVVEPKDRVVSKLGRSPDEGDAVAMAVVDAVGLNEVEFF